MATKKKNYEVQYLRTTTESETEQIELEVVTGEGREVASLLLDLLEEENPGAEIEIEEFHEL